jgi:hypothetical protein
VENSWALQALFSDPSIHYQAGTTMTEIFHFHSSAYIIYIIYIFNIEKNKKRKEPISAKSSIGQLLPAAGAYCRVVRNVY